MKITPPYFIGYILLFLSYFILTYSLYNSASLFQSFFKDFFKDFFFFSLIHQLVYYIILSLFLSLYSFYFNFLHIHFLYPQYKIFLTNTYNNFMYCFLFSSFSSCFQYTVQHLLFLLFLEYNTVYSMFCLVHSQLSQR